MSRLALAAMLAVVIAGVGTARAKPVVVRLEPACVVIDRKVDELREPERAVAKAVVVRILEQANQLVSDAGCHDHYTLTHVRADDGFVVRLVGPHSSRTRTAHTAGELPASYHELVRDALVAAGRSTPGIELDTPDLAAPAPYIPDSVTTESIESTDSTATRTRMWYGRAGGGAIRNSAGTAASYGGGFRYQFDDDALDLSFGAAATSTGGSYSVRAEMLAFGNPGSAHSLYFGGGLSLGTSAVTSGMTTFAGRGFGAEITSGFAFARGGRLELFVQADLALPFYTLDASAYSMYVPTLALSVGMGFK